MDKEELIKLFNRLLSGELKQLMFSKGYGEYEKMYELFKDDLEHLDIKRYEVDDCGYTLVILKEKENEEI